MNIFINYWNLIPDLKYFFINSKLNDTNKELMQLLKELIERNKRRNGPIFELMRLSDDTVWVYPNVFYDFIQKLLVK